MPGSHVFLYCKWYRIRYTSIMYNPAMHWPLFNEHLYTIACFIQCGALSSVAFMPLLSDFRNIIMVCHTSLHRDYICVAQLLCWHVIEYTHASPHCQTAQQVYKPRSDVVYPSHNCSSNRDNHSCFLAFRKYSSNYVFLYLTLAFASGYRQRCAYLTPHTTPDAWPISCSTKSAGKSR